MLGLKMLEQCYSFRVLIMDKNTGRHLFFFFFTENCKLILLLRFATRNAVMLGLDSEIVLMGTEGSKTDEKNNQKIMMVVL